MGLHVGTSGWAYPEWKPGFYPEDLPRARFLEHYASVLGACEINATFYRVHSAKAVTRWRDDTPDGFRFAVKAHRRLTFRRAGAPLSADRDFVDGFFSSLAPMADRVGCLLFQVPAYREPASDSVREVLELLPPGTPAAFDLRDGSGADPGVRQLVADAGATVCLSETESGVPGALPPGPIAYVRLRGDRYDEDVRAGWRDLLARESTDRDVYLFCKHETAAPEDPAAGVGLARWLHAATVPA